MTTSPKVAWYCFASLPSRGAWIEIAWRRSCAVPPVESLPSRGAWIEMVIRAATARSEQVAPLAGSVDRNGFCQKLFAEPFRVAPLAGSVDRNLNTQICR